MSVGRGARLVSSDVREHNRALVLRRLEESGPTSRADLAEATGLAKSAITVLVGELVADGLVRPAAGGPDRSRAGRPSQPLELDGSGYAVLALQVLLDERRWLVTDLAGRTLSEGTERARTPRGDPGAVAAGIAEWAVRLVEDLRRRGVAPTRLQIVAPGPVLRGGRTVFRAVDLGWDVPVDLAGLVGAALPAGNDLPVVVLNDADCATWAEYTWLRSRPGRAELADLAYVKSDTGIGGGAVVAGRLLTGNRGTAFEPGHLTLRPDGPRCACGRRGCLVTFAGPEAVLAAAGMARAAGRDGVPAAMADLLDRHGAGDARAVEALTAAAGWIRVALDLLVVTLDPEVVVLEGGALAVVADAAGGTFRGVAHGLEVELRAAALGGRGALVGAVALARAELLAGPWAPAPPT